MRVRRASRGGGGGRGRGFTLIETCIALLILMIVGLGVASLFVYAIRNNSGAGSRALALAVAQQQMEELRAASYDNVEAAVAAGGGSPKIVTMAGQQFNVTTAINYAPAAPPNALTKTIVIDVAARTNGQTAWIGVPVRFVTTRSTQRTGNYAK